MKEELLQNSNSELKNSIELLKDSIIDLKSKEIFLFGCDWTFYYSKQ